CPKIEYGRLSSEISWMGVNSRTLSSKRAPIPTQGMRLSLNRTSVGGGETAASDRAAKKLTGLHCETIVSEMRQRRNGSPFARYPQGWSVSNPRSLSPRLDGGRGCHQHAAHFEPAKPTGRIE